MILFQLPKDLVAGMRKTSRYVTALKQIFRACTYRVVLEFSHVIDIYMVMLMSCLLVCRDLIGDHRKRKKKRLHGPGCASAKELLQVLAGSCTGKISNTF